MAYTRKYIECTFMKHFLMQILVTKNLFITTLVVEINFKIVHGPTIFFTNYT